MKKKIWLTSLEGSQQTVQSILASLKSYGLEVNGHFWEDDLDKMAWCKPRQELVEGAVDMWIIHSGADRLEEPALRYGLSMLALTVQAARGVNFPIVILQQGDLPIEPAALPLPLSECSVIAGAGTAYGPKLVAALHRPFKKEFPPYRLDVYGVPQVGQWFEVGPRQTSWQGIIFGTVPAGISLHAVGPAGQLPEKCTLNYPQKGLKMTIGDREYDGWAVQNELDSQSSYFVKVDCHPEAIVFCPYTTDDEAEAYVIELK